MPPDLIVESGGITEQAQKKLHLYWQTSEQTEDAVFFLVKARHRLALKIGGDASFQSAAQPIRIAGSVHHKTLLPKLVVIREAA